VCHLRVAWIGAAIAGGLTEAIGLTAAFFPSAWLSLFGTDPGMIEVGTNYLQIVGPFHGFFGGGLALYFASQGAGRVGWAMMVAVLRVVIAAGGGWLAVVALGNSNALFVALAAALVVYGIANAASSWLSRNRSWRSLHYLLPRKYPEVRSAYVTEDSHPSSPSAWIEWGAPAGKSHRSPAKTSSMNIAPSGVNTVTRALPVSISAHSSARCQCSSRKLPLISRILTPATSLDTSSSRDVT
jgi:hypothetical protein